MSELYLGVDGGGTVTKLCLVDSDGRVVATATAPSPYYLPTGLSLVETVLREGVGTICRAAGIEPRDVTYAFFGLPAYGEIAGDVPKLDAVPYRVLGHERYRCGNDMVCGWAGSLAAADGVNVISGTGSMIYGRHGDHAERVGGWGEVFGDEGSAYWIAVRGLSAFSRMSDGRAEPGPLLTVLRDALRLGSDLELLDIVLNDWRGDRTAIASLSRQVDRAAAEGDPAALGILTDAGGELALLVATARRRLRWPARERMPVSYSGGVFSSERVLRAFRLALDRSGDAVELRRPVYSPETGAALYAAHLSGTPLSDAALTRLDSDRATY